jgi:xanthine dehydrogenase YagS FAD-binding subunit
MHPFGLSRAVDTSAAIAAHAADPQLAFIAGGTDLLGLIKDRAALPERLLDINGLRGIGQIEPLAGGGLRIGALARMSDVRNRPLRYVGCLAPRHRTERLLSQLRDAPGVLQTS